MAEMLKDSMTIYADGKPIIVPRMKFKQLKKAWVAIKRIADINKDMFPVGINMQDDPNFMVWHAEKLSCMLEVIVAAINRNDPSMTVSKLEDLLDSPEVRLVQDWFQELLAISGFETGNEPTDLMAAADPENEPSSTETGTSSSQNLSATASVEATGTELRKPLVLQS